MTSHERSPAGGESGFLLTTVDEGLRAAHAGSLWYLTFGLACCAVEMMHTAAARYDFDRFGMIPRADPRHADLMFVPIAFTLVNFSTLPDQADSHQFSAQSAHGGKVGWKGSATLDPIRGSGELTLENVSLPDVAVYLKSYSRARVAAGQLDATLPYNFAYVDDGFDASLAAR